MGKVRIPKTNYYDLDLQNYGGEGFLRIKGINIGSSEDVTSELQRIAVRDGYNLDEIDKRSAEIDAKYKGTLILLYVKHCTSIEEDGHFRSLTDEEIKDLPAPLVRDIYIKIHEMSEFPLVQNGGEAQKQEQ